jgi:hypothetical protein
VGGRTWQIMMASTRPKRAATQRRICAARLASRDRDHMGCGGCAGVKEGLELGLGLLTRARRWFESMRMMEKRMERRAILRSEVSPQHVCPRRGDRPYDAVKRRGHDIVRGDIRRFGEDG